MGLYGIRANFFRLGDNETITYIFIDKYLGGGRSAVTPVSIFDVRERTSGFSLLGDILFLSDAPHDIVNGPLRYGREVWEVFLQVIQYLRARQKRRRNKLVHNKVSVGIKLARMTSGLFVKVLVELRFAHHHLIAADCVPVDSELDHYLLLR